MTDLTLFISRPWIPAYASSWQCGEYIDMVQGNRPYTVSTLDKKFGEVPWGWAEFVVIVVCFIGYWPVILLLHVLTYSGCKWNSLFKCACWLKEENPFTYSLVWYAHLTLCYIFFCWFCCWVVEETLHMQGFLCMTLPCQCKFISSAPVRCSWATDKLHTILPKSNSWVMSISCHKKCYYLYFDCS
jgi:hypothetical protein